VGGTLFRTTTTTLCFEQSLFTGMFSGRFPVEPNSEGHYFIDRSPKWFASILDYLRTREFALDIVSLSEKDRRSLKLELDYYGIESLLQVYETIMRPVCRYWFLLIMRVTIKELSRVASCGTDFGQKLIPQASNST
jgi:hypothetical protein